MNEINLHSVFQDIFKDRKEFDPAATQVIIPAVFRPIEAKITTEVYGVIQKALKVEYE